MTLQGATRGSWIAAGFCASSGITFLAHGRPIWAGVMVACLALNVWSARRSELVMEGCRLGDLGRYEEALALFNRPWWASFFWTSPDASRRR